MSNGLDSDQDKHCVVSDLGLLRLNYLQRSLADDKLSSLARNKLIFFFLMDFLIHYDTIGMGLSILYFKCSLVKISRS